MIDNNLPPALAEMLDPMARISGHRVVHKRDYFGRTNIPDVIWMAELGKEIDAAYLTQDTSIRRKKAEIAAFRDSNITGFWLVTKTWQQYLKQDQLHILAARLLLKWETLVNATTISSGLAFEIPVKGEKLISL